MLTEELQTHSILPAVGRFGLCCWLGCVVVTLGSCLLPFWVLFVYCPLPVDSRVLLVCCLLCVCVALISCLACLVTLISCLACLLSAVCCLLSAVCCVYGPCFAQAVHWTTRSLRGTAACATSSCSRRNY